MLKNRCDYRIVENSLQKIHMISIYTETPQWSILSIFWKSLCFSLNQSRTQEKVSHSKYWAFWSKITSYVGLEEENITGNILNL